jgi:hypothetical protein
MHMMDVTTGIVSYVDAVLNHKFGADCTERFRAIEVDPNDRTRDITDKYDIEVSASGSLVIFQAWLKVIYLGMDQLRLPWA